MRTFSLTALLALCVACAPAVGEGSGASAPTASAAEHPTLEQLAAMVDCTPKIQVDAADMRSAHCETTDGEFFLSTFTTEKGKDDWMFTAPEYSPHLVGPRWSALADRKVLDLLHLRLGGELHLKDHRTMTPPPAR